MTRLSQELLFPSTSSAPFGISTSSAKASSFGMSAEASSQGSSTSITGASSQGSSTSMTTETISFETLSHLRNPNTPVLVNSERSVWLGVNGLNDEKPDFHVTHWAFHAPENSHYGTECFFGGLSDPFFIKEMNFIVEGKIVKLANTELGIMIDYLSRQGASNPAPRGLMYNQSKWIYFRNDGPILVECFRGKWIDCGSFEICITSLFHSGLSDQILSWYQGKFRLQLLAYGECPSEEKALSLLKQVTARVQTLKCCDN